MQLRPLNYIFCSFCACFYHIQLVALPVLSFPRETAVQYVLQATEPTDPLVPNPCSHGPQFGKRESHRISPFHYIKPKLILMVLILCATEFKVQHSY